MEVSVGLFALAAAILFLLGRKQVSLFSPLALYALGQVIPLGIAYLKIDDRMTDFHLATWFVWWGSLLSFLAGVALVSLRPVSVFSAATEPILRNRKTLGVVLLAFLIYATTTLMGYAVHGSWPILSRHPENARMDFVKLPFPLGLGQSFNWILLAMCPALALRSKGFLRWLHVALLALSFLYGVLTGFRLVMLFALFSIVATRDLMVRRIKPFRLAAAFLAFLVFSSAMLLVRSGHSSSGQRGAEKIAAGMMAEGAYLYVANNFWNLDYAITRQLGTNPHPHTLGGLFFEAPLSIIGPMGKVEESLDWDTWRNEKSIKYQSLNTISYQWSLVKEAGWFGVLFLPGLLGAFATLLYRKIVVHRSEWALLLYIPIGFSIFFSFFLYMYETPMYWFIWTAYGLVYITTRIRPRPPPAAPAGT